MLLRIYDEFVRLKKDLAFLLTYLDIADKLALLFALFMLSGVFMPWVSAKGHFTQNGLMGGGDIYLLLAILTFYQGKMVAMFRIKSLRKKSHKELTHLRLKRISLTYMLIGLLSVISAIFILLYFGSQYDIINDIVDIRVGFYLTTLSGLAIFFCGLQRFYL